MLLRDCVCDLSASERINSAREQLVVRMGQPGDNGRPHGTVEVMQGRPDKAVETGPRLGSTPAMEAKMAVEQARAAHASVAEAPGATQRLKRLSNLKVALEELQRAPWLQSEKARSLDEYEQAEYKQAEYKQAHRQWATLLHRLRQCLEEMRGDVRAKLVDGRNPVEVREGGIR